MNRRNFLAAGIALQADGFDEAVIGRTTGSVNLWVYAVDKCVDILMESSDMTREDAVEYFYFNVAGSYVGPGTPIFVET